MSGDCSKTVLSLCLTSALSRFFLFLLGVEVTLETLSHSPRVFSLENFMDMEEADNIIEDALGMTQEAYRLKVGAARDNFGVSMFKMFSPAYGIVACVHGPHASCSGGRDHCRRCSLPLRCAVCAKAVYRPARSIVAPTRCAVCLAWLRLWRKFCR